MAFATLKSRIIPCALAAGLGLASTFTAAAQNDRPPDCKALEVASATDPVPTGIQINILNIYTILGDQGVLQSVNAAPVDDPDAQSKFTAFMAQRNMVEKDWRALNEFQKRLLMMNTLMALDALWNILGPEEMEDRGLEGYLAQDESTIRAVLGEVEYDDFLALPPYLAACMPKDPALPEPEKPGRKRVLLLG